MIENLNLFRAKRKHEKHKMYPVEKRIQLVSTYLAMGNLRAACALVNINYDTANKWKASTWWPQMVAEIQNARKSQVDSKLNKIIDKALAVIEDRLDHGDFVYNQKTGEVDRKPVSLKEARGAANDMMQRQLALSKMELETQTAASNTSVKDQIALLAAEFAKFNTKRTVEVVPNAIYEGRETRLQEGTGVGTQQEAHTSEGQSSSQSSQSNNGEGWKSEQGGRNASGPQAPSLEGWDEYDDEFESDNSSEEYEFLEEFGRKHEESDK